MRSKIPGLWNHRTNAVSLPKFPSLPFPRCDIISLPIILSGRESPARPEHLFAVINPSDPTFGILILGQTIPTYGRRVAVKCSGLKGGVREGRGEERDGGDRRGKRLYVLDHGAIWGLPPRRLNNGVALASALARPIPLVFVDTSRQSFARSRLRL